RTAIRADLPRAPRLRGEPFAHVVAVAQLAPLQPAVAAVNALALVRAAVVYERDDEAAFGELRRRLARAGAADVRIALLEDRRPLAFALRKKDVGREPLAVAHGNHEVLLAHAAEV